MTIVKHVVISFVGFMLADDLMTLSEGFMIEALLNYWYTHFIPPLLNVGSYLASSQFLQLTLHDFD
jgi:hypothetical protein